MTELQGVQAETPGTEEVDLGILLEAAEAWGAAAQRLETRADALLQAGDTESRAAARAIERINRALMRQERALIQRRGLPGRPWFRHQVYAPGLVTGYAVQYLPGMRDAIEQGDAATARTYRDLLLDSLHARGRAARRPSGAPLRQLKRAEERCGVGREPRAREAPQRAVALERRSAPSTRSRSGLPCGKVIAHCSPVGIRPASAPTRSGACVRSTPSCGASPTIASQRPRRGRPRASTGCATAGRRGAARSARRSGPRPCCPSARRAAAGRAPRACATRQLQPAAQQHALVGLEVRPREVDRLRAPLGDR